MDADKLRHYSPHQWQPRRVEPGAIVSDEQAEQLLAAEACTELGADDDICRPPFNRATLAVLLFSGTGMAGVIGWAVLARLN